MTMKTAVRVALMVALLGSWDLLPANGEDYFDESSPCSCGGWDAGFELATLQWIIPRDPGSTAQSDGVDDMVYVQPRGNYKASPRVWLSYLNESGVGFRGRYFSYDSDSDRLENVEYPDESLQFHVQLRTTDIEMLFHKSGQKWSTLISGGVRITDFEFQDQWFDYDGEYNDRTQLFEGYGPTLSIEARRHGLWLTPFANIRGSVMYGDRIGRNNLTGALERDIEPALYTYFEGQLGLEYTKTVGSGELFFRTALESHYSPLLGTMSETSSDNEEDNMHWGLIGGTFAAGVRF